MKFPDATRGLSIKDRNALESLSILLEDWDVVDIDVEPGVNCYAITARDRLSNVLFSGKGKSITDAVESVARAALGSGVRPN